MLKRLQRELNSMGKNPIENVSIDVNPTNIQKIVASISNLENTPYEQGTYYLEVYIPMDYPFKPPKVKFLTKIYHPNVDSSGEIWFFSINDNWTPTSNILKYIYSVMDLMSNPLPRDPYDPLIGKHWETDKADAEKTAKEWCFLYALIKYE